MAGRGVEPHQTYWIVWVLWGAKTYWIVWVLWGIAEGGVEGEAWRRLRRASK